MNKLGMMSKTNKNILEKTQALIEEAIGKGNHSISKFLPIEIVEELKSSGFLVKEIAKVFEGDSQYEISWE